MLFALPFVSSACFLLAPVRMAGAAEDAFGPPRIEVSGTGKIAAAPDFATITLGVVKQGRAATEALAANDKAMNALTASLKEHGIAAKDIQTSEISVTPQYTRPRRNMNGEEEEGFTPRIVGYQVSNTIYVKVREIPKMGTILDAVVEAGSNQIWGISFGLEKPEKLLDEARKRAMAEAKRKAILLAGEAGVVVGSALVITDSAEIVPGVQNQMMSAYGLAAAPAATPIAAGELEVSVTVQVKYKLIEPK